MIHDTKDTNDALNNQQSNQCGRINSSDSGRSLLSMNLNFLGSCDDVALDGGLLGLGSDIRIQSSDFVKDILLPDKLSTNDTIEDDEQPIKQYDGKYPAQDDDELCSIAKLTSKLERISTGRVLLHHHLVKSINSYHLKTGLTILKKTQMVWGRCINLCLWRVAILLFNLFKLIKRNIKYH